MLKTARNAALPLRNRLEAYDSLSRMSDPGDLRVICAERGLLYREARDYVNEARAFHEGVHKAHKDSLSLRCDFLLNAMGAQLRGGMFKGVFDDALRILSMKKPDSLVRYDIGAYLVVSDAFVHLYNYDKGHEYLEKAKKLMSGSSRECFSPQTRAYMEFNMLMAEGNVLLNKKEYDKALDVWRKARKSTSDPDMARVADASIGLIFLRQGDYRSAVSYVEDIMPDMKGTVNGPYAILNYIYSLAGKGDYESASRALKTYSDELSLLSGSPEQADLESVKSEIAERRGDIRSALGHLRTAYALLDSIGLVDRTAYSTGLDAGIQEWERNAGEGNKKPLTVSLPLASAMILVLILLAWAVFMYMTRKVRKERDSCQRLERRLAEVEAELAEAGRLAEDTAKRNVSDLGSVTLKLAAISEAVEKIQSASSGKLSDKEAVKEIRRSLAGLREKGDLWNLFKGYFEELNQNFFDRLYRLHPELTNAETRMCAFIMMNMTTKEIASMTNRSPRTVHCIKYNLRQKCGITGSTEEYLRHISSVSKKEFETMLQNRWAVENATTV
jgi:tetratricopeptide (TPR) repeat protein